MDRLSKEDIFLPITRDADGKLEPVEIFSPLFGKSVRIVPMTYGFIKKHSCNMDLPAVQWPDELKVLVIREHLVDPDMSDFTLEKAESEMDPTTFNHLVVLAVAYSIPFLRNRMKNNTGWTLQDMWAGLLLGESFKSLSRASIDTDISSLVKETSTDSPS